MQNTIAVRKANNTIVLRVSDPNDWEIAKRVANSREYGPGIYTYNLSVQNLEKIYQAFQGSKRPVVVEGSEVLDSLRVQLTDYRKRVREIQQIVASERFPVEPNGKFHPYAHQTKAIGAIIANPFSPVMLSCGLGKTGSTARAVELMIERGEVQKGKVLVSAPLSILYSSWMDDIQKFTSLRADVLWSHKPNKTKLGEKERLGRHERTNPPEGALVIKKKEHVAYYSRETKRLKLKATALDQAETQWTKYRVSYSVALDADGNETPFGDIYGRTASKENTKNLYLQERLSNSDTDVFLINHDGVRIYEDILTQHGFEWVIVDESTKIKSHEAKVTQAHLAISENAKRRNILSGTPNPNGFQDLWSQFYFLDRGLTLGTSMKDYLAEYFVPKVSGYYKLPNGVRKEAVTYIIASEQDRNALVGAVKAPGIYLEQRDCIDLPPRTDMTRAVIMTPEQEAAYTAMEDNLVAELEDSQTKSSIQVEAVNTLSKIMKLRQITSGFLLDTSSGGKAKISSPKLEDLDDLLEELGDQKLVVACQFREEIEQLLSRYKKHGVAAVYGGVSLEERTQAISDFQKTDKVRVMVLQPQAAAHGITLTAASYMVFLSLDYNFEFYYQTAKRIERIGQRSPIFVIHSVARFADGSATIDEDLMHILGSKNRDRNALFQSSNQSLDEVVGVMRDRLRSRVLARRK
jgi:SNF2 family DNA or RNA helicase